MTAPPRRLVPSANHHLWRNRRTWWAAFTVVHDGHRQQRVRRSLGTLDVVEARARRDQLMREYAARPGVVLSVRGSEHPLPGTGVEGTVPPPPRAPMPAACLPWDWD